MQNCVEKARRDWSAVLDLVVEEGCPDLPPPKVFKPKFNLAKLQDYKGPAPSSYWGRFPTNKDFPGKSKIDPVQLRALAAEYGVTGDNLDICLVDLEYGADIGCRGAARQPSFSSNAPSAYDFGPQVSDAIAEWVAKGYAAGPFKLEEIPANVTINGIMCKEKPNGSVRIILNLSCPKESGVNSGINKDDFPAIMSSTPKWVRSLNLVGPGGYMCKLDWASAYKHISVRLADLPLQWFKWLDRYFLETSLIFGGVSSVGIYDRHAKILCSSLSWRPPGSLGLRCVNTWMMYLQWAFWVNFVPSTTHTSGLPSNWVLSWLLEMIQKRPLLPARRELSLGSAMTLSPGPGQSPRSVWPVCSTPCTPFWIRSRCRVLRWRVLLGSSSM